MKDFFVEIVKNLGRILVRIFKEIVLLVKYAIKN